MSASERRRARAGAVRQPKASSVGASRWRERPPAVDIDALAAKTAGWRRKAEAARAKRAG